MKLSRIVISLTLLIALILPVQAEELERIFHTGTPPVTEIQDPGGSAITSGALKDRKSVVVGCRVGLGTPSKEVVSARKWSQLETSFSLLPARGWWWW